MDGDSYVLFIQVFIFSANLVFDNSIFQQGHPASSEAFKRSKGSSGPLGLIMNYFHDLLDCITLPMRQSCP